MGMNIFEKIISAHLISGEMVPGNEISIRVDQTLTQDALGTMAYLQFESMGIDRVKTDSVSYVDHNTLQDGFENADDHRYLQTVADRYGIRFSKAGNGICHQVHLERFSKPGATLIGSDSHTPTCGAAGMVAIGVGGLDVAVAMAGGPYYLVYPKVINVVLSGRLRPWCSAKDVILEILRRLTTRGNTGKVLEYSGPGLETFSVPERATISNMGAELGVTTSVFPSDEVTRQFFSAQDRGQMWRELAADIDSEYDGVIEIDLGMIEPLAACPHSPDKVKPVREIAGIKVDQVLAGSCTNSSYRDISMLSYMLKGKKINPEVSFGIAPGSRQVLSMAAERGDLNILLQAGARILETACGFCVGCGQSPQSNSVSLRTNNRNFEGRSGTSDAMVYLVSPETAAASAITGVITDPGALGLPYRKPELPDKFPVDDALLLEPSCSRDTVIFRGPNIGEPPKNIPMPDTLEAKVAIKVGDNVTTDHIMPAGRYLKYRSNIPKYSEFVFYNTDSGFAQKCRKNSIEGKGSVIVAGLSYGQGSSREHAAICPMYLGVKILLAKSVERIHASNLVNFGILQLIFEDDKDYEKIDADDELFVSGLRGITERGGITVKNISKGIDIKARCTLTSRQREIVLAGGALNYAAAASGSSAGMAGSEKNEKQG